MGNVKVSQFNAAFARGVGKVLDKVVKGLNDLATSVNEQRTDHATTRTVVGDLKTLVNDIRTKLLADCVLNVPGLAEGSTPQNVATSAVYYRVAGQLYYKAAVPVGTALSGDDIPQSKYGAWALDLGTDGTIDITAASANATGYDSAVLAAGGLPAVAASHVRLGYVTASKSDGVFDPGTTSLADANTTEAYTDSALSNLNIGSAVSSSPPAALSASAVTIEVERSS